MRFSSSDDEIRYIQSDSPIYSDHLSDPTMPDEQTQTKDLSISRSFSPPEKQGKKKDPQMVREEIIEGGTDSIIIIDTDSLYKVDDAFLVQPFLK